MLKHFLPLVLLLVTMLNGCATRSEKAFIDRSISDHDELFLVDMGKAHLVHETHVITEQLPPTESLAEGMASREVFHVLGKATAMCLDKMEVPPTQLWGNFGYQPGDPMTEWSTCAFWKLAEIQGDEVHLLDVTVRFEKTVPKSEHRMLGIPLSPDGDEGWKIRSISVIMKTEPL